MYNTNWLIESKRWKNWWTWVHPLIFKHFAEWLWFHEDMWEEIEQWYKDIMNKIRENKKQKKNWLYLMKSAWYYKIWIAIDPFERLKSLETGNPFDIELLFFAQIDNSLILERYFHKIFRKKNKKWEWFKLNDNDLSDIFLIFYHIELFWFDYFDWSWSYCDLQ
jgi:hypothetical protein